MLCDEKHELLPRASACFSVSLFWNILYKPLPNKHNEKITNKTANTLTTVSEELEDFFGLPFGA